MRTIPVEQFAGFINEQLFNDPTYHEHMARIMIPSTHTMLSWNAEESSTDILTGEKRYAIVAYAYRSEPTTHHAGCPTADPELCEIYPCACDHIDADNEEHHNELEYESHRQDTP